MASEDQAAIDVDDMVAQVDTGARNPSGWQGQTILVSAFTWAMFQVDIASNLPFWLAEITGLGYFIVTIGNATLIHLAFASFLAAMAFPLLKSSPRGHIPWYDWALGILSVISCLYIVVNFDSIADRAGLPTTGDLVISSVGMTILAISVYRSLGLPLMVISSVFVAYVFFGDTRWLPEVIQWKGASYGKAMWHFWMQTEGVFGVALGVSTRLIFLFVLFGAILEKSGAGNYFIKLAFALMGHFRGGPAKAAVVASALSGLYSGSSIANTVTTGTFTIPLMKRTGFTAEKAGAVEVASSTNGQLMPPVMGAAAFLIAEFTGVPYTDILKHALLPAVVSYIALIYIVHLEAMKLDLKGLKKPPTTMTFAIKMILALSGFIGTAVLFGAVYFGLGWVDKVAPQSAFYVVMALSAVAYLVLLWIAAKQPDLEMSDPNAPILELPRAGETAITGLYYVLPIVILIWCILPTPDRLSPSLSAFYATVAMTIIALTHRPIKELMRGSGNFAPAFRLGLSDWVAGMISGSRNMISIGIATAAAGIIIGTISLTGAHQVIGAFIETMAGGSLLFMLVLVAIMSLILGMGLPTTANYIVVSSLMAPVIVTLGAKGGLIVPLIAVHLFVFYFGILADDTPPVGLAAFAASAISGGDPIKTGLQGFAYDIRTALLPFLFLFNTELLLIDVSPAKAVFVFAIAVIAMMLFAAATQHYFFVRNRIWETIALLLIAFTLFRPGFWLDMVAAPFDDRPGTEITALAGKEPADGNLRIRIAGPDFTETDVVNRMSMILPLGAAGDGAQRLEKLGLLVTKEDGKAKLEEPLSGTELEHLGRKFDFYGDDPVTVTVVMMPTERMAKEVFYLPAALVLVLIVLLQRRRRPQAHAAAAAAA
jgi:TRAP transporter 4TM/12TM fusion protein